MQSTVYIIAVLCIIVFFAIKSTVYRIIHGSACCGERDAPVKKVKVKDKNKSHYVYSCTAYVEGMRCSNCARSVENALNSLDGIWAKANIEKKCVNILSKSLIDESLVISAVAKAGYTVLSFK
jgi:copper chaperone CopZ